MSDSIHECTQAIASGDPEAFANFYDAWFDRMYQMAKQCTRRDESFCLDVVQDAMMKVIRSMKPMHDEAALNAWLCTVVRSCAIDRLRRELNERRRIRTRRAAPERLPDHGIALDELQQRINRAIAALDEPQRTIVLLRYRSEWTLQQIGRVLGMGAGAVDGRLRRAMSTLRQRLAETNHE